VGQGVGTIYESVHDGSEEAKGTDRKWDELHVGVVELANDFITRKGDASLFACDGAVATLQFPLSVDSSFFRMVRRSHLKSLHASGVC
jgi:hypothetical protein